MSPETKAMLEARKIDRVAEAARIHELVEARWAARQRPDRNHPSLLEYREYMASIQPL